MSHNTLECCIRAKDIFNGSQVTELNVTCTLAEAGVGEVFGGSGAAPPGGTVQGAEKN